MSTFTPTIPIRPSHTVGSHTVVRLLLFFMLALGVALPTTALAAPVRQPTDTAEAELLSYYESEEIELDDTAVFVGLYFYDDDTFELELDFTGDDEDSVAYGDFEETDDGVTLTLLGADNEDFEESVEVELVWDADDTLVIVGDPDGLMGEEDIILYPVDFTVAPDEDADDGEDAGEEIEEGIDEGVDDDLDEELDSVLSGVYVSPVQASDNVVYILNLLADGTASLNSDYLNLEPPIFEVGTWTDNGDDTVTVEIAGTVEEEYENPIIIDFTLGEYGELVVEGIYLYPLEIFTYLQEDDSGAEIGSAESEVYVYVAEVTYPDADEATYVYMFIYDDGTVVISDEAETATLYGEWIFDEDEILTVSITADDEGEFEGVVELVFEFNEERALVATEYPVEVFGEDELIFYPSEEDDEAVTEGEFYFYESEPLPSEETEGIIISLVLSADGAATVSTDYMNDEDPFLEYGEWTRDDDGAVIVTVNESDEEVYDEPYVFTFEEDPDDLSLVLVEESVEVFGEEGLVLNRIE